MRFDALDGLRGIVALAVVIYHYGDHLGLPWLPHAWVAVDTFFILSGFVLAHSYTRRVHAGMGFVDFARTRLARLYPLYLVGLLLGATDVAIEIAQGRIAMDWDDWALATVLGALLVPHGVNALIPFGNDVIAGAVFPFNEPSWSLFFELAVNVVFFYWLAARRAWTVIPIILASLGAFWAAAHVWGGLHGGWGVDDFWVGVPRVMFGFFLGVGLYRIHPRVSPVLKRVGPWFVLLLLVTFWRPFRWQEAWSLFVFAPLAVVANAGVELGAHARAWCDWAGRLSYPLYITHFPLFRLLWVEGDIRRLGSVGHLLTAVAVAVALAWVLAVADERWRKRRSVPRRVAGGAASGFSH
jgi:peptidoglycan/LPS O-acetylase OafA/YrhL